MTSTTHAAGAVRGRRNHHPSRVRARVVRWARLAVDGRRPWGALEVGPVDRTASAMSYRLTVYPPGITTVERRALVFRRHWPGSGLALALLLAVAFGELMNGFLAIALAAALFAAGFLVAAALAGNARRRVIRLRAMVFSTLGHHEVLGELDAIERAAGVLLALDELADAAALTPAEYECRWNAVYQELAASGLGV